MFLPLFKTHFGLVTVESELNQIFHQKFPETKNNFLNL